MSANIEVIQGDITKQIADAIVNAANNSLLGGGGVDGAIHRSAGPKLLDYCRTLNGCPTGEAKISPGFNLSSKYIIHTVGPVWYGGHNNEPELLKKCYQNSLRLAIENNCNTIVFPCISTGVYNFPKKEAAKIAVGTISEFIRINNCNIKVTVCSFDSENYNIYKQEIEHL